MNRLSVAWLVAAAVAGAAGVSTQAVADNPLGAYVGVGVGQSNVANNNYDNLGYYGPFHDHDATWKLIAGVRPLPFVGAEIEYIDFGSGNGDNGYYGSQYYTSESSHPKATVLYGLGYLPLPLPFLDVYGKLGVARLQTNIDTAVSPQPGYCSQPAGGTVPAGGSCATFNRTDQTDTRLAYGAGVQAKWQDFAFRAEYERISSQFGDPAAFTVSATWTF